MATKDLTIGIIFLTQTVVGILGNFSLLCRYIILYFTKFRLRSTDLILKHLLVANSISLLAKGVPETMAAFGWQHFLNDFECKLVFFFHRVGRGMSVASICLLSVFQAITISPRNSRWAQLKVRAPKCVVPSTFLCWILHMLVNVIFPMYISAKLSDENITDIKDFGYCASVRHDQTMDVFYIAILSLPDVLCFILILWASGSMVFILYRHKKRIQHIHRTSSTFGSSPESRATKSILILMSTFIYFYTLSTIFHSFISIFENPSWILWNINSITILCFPTFSPFLFMSHDSSISRLFFAWIRNIKSPNLIRNM